jgi:N-acyl-L-homoserine lactone synthetase
MLMPGCSPLPKSQMKVIKSLLVQIANEKVQLDFGILDTPQEFLNAFKLRYKIYAKYGYLRSDVFPNGIEQDRFDTQGNCVYFAAQVGERQLGHIRLVIGSDLPIQGAYVFNTMQLGDKQITAELGRLVVDKYSDDSHTPRNIILLFLASCLVSYCKQHSISYAYAFLKKRLISKLRTIGLPYRPMNEYELIYPSDGPMAPYFYSESDPATPCYLELEKVEEFLNHTLENKNLLNEIKPGVYELRTTLYTRFLRSVGVI